MKPIQELIQQLSPHVEFRHGALYVPLWICTALGNHVEQELLGLEWLTRRTARHEYFMSDEPRTYSYGGGGKEVPELYHSKPFSPLTRLMMLQLNRSLGTRFNVCFLNKYDDDKQHLGWHADDFPGMIAEEPIACLSFGAERDIWVKDKRGIKCACQNAGMHDGDQRVSPCQVCDGTGWTKGEVPKDQRFRLAHGSLFLMPPGYQDTHLHRIPKHDRPCGWRISLTFRSFQEVPQ
jgi:alkylated DNA repair dioxygenase AlkB